jgi:putative hydrolase of the HAD superfamily
LKNNGNILAVLFDFGGVLAEEGFINGLMAIARAQGLKGDEVVHAAFDAIYVSGYVLGKAPERVFWAELRAKTGITGADKDLRHEIFSRFILRDWMLHLAKKLKAMNITVGILSDQTDILDQLNAQFDFFKGFDYVFNSYHLGKGKRDISLFDDVAEILKTVPPNILFVDDSQENVERARQKEWKAIHYRDRPSFQQEFHGFFPSIGMGDL